MRIEVLGAQGGEMPGCHATAFRLDGCLAVDAGGLAATLSIEEQCRLEHVLITHPHLDHIKDLAFVSDLRVGRRQESLDVHAAPGVVAALRSHFFNDILWPDFTAIPTRSAPVVRLDRLIPCHEQRVGEYVVCAVPVTHSVVATGFVISGRGATVAFSGDTGPTELFWDTLDRLPRLDAVFVEVSFPNSLQRIADASLHLTPQTLDEELNKWSRHDVPVYLYHLKPAFIAMIEREIAQLRRPALRVLRDGDVIEGVERAAAMSGCSARPAVSLRW
jgi:cAMP phosphodiesterase